MGSATREALVAARKSLASVGDSNGLAIGEQLLKASRVIGESAQLRSALADPSAAPKDKAAVIAAVFSGIDKAAQTLLAALVAERWSDQDDLLAGIEEIAIRAIASAASNGTSIEDELFTFGTAVSSDAGLELAVGSKLGSAASKSTLVTALLAKGASAETLAIVDHLVQQPRGRRIAELLRTASSIVADVAGQTIATVFTATPLSAVQLDRLGTGLAKTYGRKVKLNQVIDPAIIGGLRVQVGDDVIDGSVSTRLTQLRLQLAG